MSTEDREESMDDLNSTEKEDLPRIKVSYRDTKSKSRDRVKVSSNSQPRVPSIND